MTIRHLRRHNTNRFTWVFKVGFAVINTALRRKWKMTSQIRFSRCPPKSDKTSLCSVRARYWLLEFSTLFSTAFHHFRQYNTNKWIWFSLLLYTISICHTNSTNFVLCRVHKGFTCNVSRILIEVYRGFPLKIKVGCLYDQRNSSKRMGSDFPNTFF